ncbi:MAG: hypothetical protein ACKOE4_04270 [Candidatus Kapaibacterium sp.]
MKSWMIAVVALLALNVVGTAQTTSDLNKALQQRISGIAKRYADSVVLRWAPSTPALWKKAKASGYRIERSEGQGTFTELTGSPVKVWTPAQWEQYADANKSADMEAIGPVAIAAILSDDAMEPSDYPANDPGQVDALREARSRFEMAFSMAALAAERSRDAATGLGMRFVDKTAKAGVAYQYRITLLGDTKPYTVAPAMVDVGAEPTRVAVDNVGLSVDELDGSVLLKWNNSTGHSTFDVYRSTDERNYTKLTKSPILTLRNGGGPVANSYLDSNLTNYQPYYYKIVGNNAFAETDMLGIIKAVPRDGTPPAMPVAVKATHEGVRDVVITWEMTEPVSEDLAGFLIMRDTAVDGSFDRAIVEKPLEKGARQYRDQNVILGGTYYYQVVAVDTARNAVRSMPAYVAFADSIAPSPGVLVKGTMDTNGVVRIVVQHPADRDLMGYRLLHANDPSHEFTVRRDLFNEDSVFNRSDTIIVDTLEVRTLTKYAYYQVVALDYHFNEAAVSNTLAVPRPDIIPPVAPVIRDYVVTDSTILLDVVPSSSRDVRNHVALRRLFDAQNPDRVAWDSLSRMGQRDSIVEDRTPARSRTFQYAVVAYDSAGNKSPLSNIVTIKRVDNMVRPAVKDLSASYDSTTKRVTLRWSYERLDEPHSFVVYKKTASGLQAYAMIKDDRQREYIDLNDARRGEVYAVKVICTSGAESKLSSTAEVR